MSDSGAWHAKLVAHETATTDAWHAERRPSRCAEPQLDCQGDNRAAAPEHAPR